MSIKCREDTAAAAKDDPAVKAITDKANAAGAESLVQECKDEERAIRIRGTYTMSLIDTEFKLGAWKMTDKEQNGAKNRADQPDFVADAGTATTPDITSRKLKRLRKAKHSKKKNNKKHKKHKKEYVRVLDSANDKVRLETDRAIKEAMKLMNNTDVRPMNLMQTTKIELPNMCKKALDKGESVSIASRAQNLTDCWCRASESADTSQITYLSLPYLNVQ